MARTIKAHYENIIIVAFCVFAIAFFVYLHTASGKSNPPTYEVYSGATDQGVLSGVSNRTLLDFATVVGTTNKAIVVLKHTNESGATTQYRVATALDLSSYSNITFAFENGAQLSVVDGVSGVTFNRPSNIEATSRQQVISGTSMYFSTSGVVYPEWFGAIGDGTTDDTVEIQAAMDSCAKGNVVELSGVTYYIGSLVFRNDDTLLLGTGRRSTTLNYNGAGTLLYGACINNGQVKNMTLITASGVSGIHLYGGRFWQLDNLYINGFSGHGVYLQGDNTAPTCGMYNTLLANTWVHKCGIGYEISSENLISGTSNRANDNTLFQCTATHYTTYGIIIKDGTGNSIVGGAFELDSPAPFYTAAVKIVDADYTYINLERIENNASGITVDVATTGLHIANYPSTSGNTTFFESDSTATTNVWQEQTKMRTSKELNIVRPVDTDIYLSMEQQGDTYDRARYSMTSKGWKYSSGVSTYDTGSNYRGAISASSGVSEILIQVPMDANSVYKFEAVVVGIDASGVSRAMFAKSAFVRRAGGLGSFLQTANLETDYKTDGRWSADFGFPGSGVSTYVYVSGVTGTKINWTGKLDFIKVSE